MDITVDVPNQWLMLVVDFLLAKVRFSCKASDMDASISFA
jgi:hypothetical protein